MYTILASWNTRSIVIVDTDNAIIDAMQCPTMASYKDACRDYAALYGAISEHTAPVHPSTLHVAPHTLYAALHMLGDAFEASHGKRLTCTTLPIPSPRIMPHETLNALHANPDALHLLAYGFGF